MAGIIDSRRNPFVPMRPMAAPADNPVARGAQPVLPPAVLPGAGTNPVGRPATPGISRPNPISRSSNPPFAPPNPITRPASPPNFPNSLPGSGGGQGGLESLDTVPAMLSEGEYVLPADIVAMIGRDKLDALIRKHHQPSGQEDSVADGLRHYADGSLVTPEIPALSVPLPAPTPAPAPAPAPNPYDAVNQAAAKQAAAIAAGTVGPWGSGTAWTPTQGIANDIKGITPQNVSAVTYDPAAVPAAQQAAATGYTAQGYKATLAPEAQGYKAQGYIAQQGEVSTADENLSQAIDRIMAADSPLLQRAQAMADQDANARGLINSSMAVQSGRAAVLDKSAQIGAGDIQSAQFNAAQKNQMSAFNAEQRNNALAFLANATNVAAQFLAAEQNQNGRFNAEQSNNAAAFTAQAQNQASAFLAAAQNTAAMFNSGEANRLAMFSVEQSNQAKQFAASAQNAASQFNATAYNTAMQRYVDAFNAAIAAQNDAVNLSRRDTAQIKASAAENDARVGGMVAAAGISASAQIASAQIHAGSAAAALAQNERQFNMTYNAQQSQFLAGLNAQQFNQYQSGLQAGMSIPMEPADRQAWLHNYNSAWSASGTLPFNINMDAFPPPGGTPAP